MESREMGISFTTLDGKARDWARSMEDREASRAGSLANGRCALSRRYKIPLGVFDGLRRERTKSLSVGVFERIRAAFIRELEQEIARCVHELEMARQCGLDPRSADMAALETAMAQAEKLMGRE